MLKFNKKAKELLSILQDELPDDSVVVWFKYNAEMRGVASLLKQKGIVCESIAGDTPEQERWNSIKRFNQKEFKILLCQAKVGLYGLNLSVASTAIYYSNHWSLETRVQSEDRIEHMSKKEPLLIIDLVTEKSIDEDVIKALKSKEIESNFYLKQRVKLNMMRRLS
jgi:SWI/SNF-related matrix-associated actin-dependent regulator 1 of chromatin subfamily A